MEIGGYWSPTPGSYATVDSPVVQGGGAPEPQCILIVGYKHTFHQHREERHNLYRLRNRLTNNR